MAKKRIHELAKELKVESKAIMRELEKMGVENKKNASCSLDEDLIVKVVKSLKINEPAAKEVKSEVSVAAKPDKPEEKKQKSKTDMKKTNNRPSASGNRERSSKRNDNKDYIVDRVPSRPPDKRFDERRKVGGAEAGAAAAGKESRSAQRPAGEQRNRSNNNRPAGERKEGERREGDRRFNNSDRPHSNNPRPSGNSENRRDRPSSGSDRSSGSRPANQSGNKYGRPQSSRPQSARPAPGGQLKVPKAPEQAADADRVKASEKQRNKIAQNQNRNNQNKPKEKNRNWNLNKNYLNEDERFGSKKRKPNTKVQSNRETVPAPQVEKKPVVIGELTTVQQLAEKMKKSPAELIKKLMSLGVFATINQEVDVDTATILCNEYGFEVEVKIVLDAEALIEQELEDDPKDLKARPCVVTVMGHVDHGKTSLLDAIRQTNVIATEAGGITQHIGAYQVEHSGKKITFVDTPGHEAFTAMRARGAEITDIAILVIAADDGIMPQTIEAINHAKAAEVPIIIALNKIDKPGADPDKIRQQMTEHDLVPEEWGGDTIVVPVSAKTREGLDNLLEMILLVAEVSELKANPNRDARGTVIEAELDKGRGPVATVLVQNGTLKLGDSLVAGAAFGKVRAMMDDKGRRIKKADPSTPVEVLGFHDVPLAGDLFYGLSDEKAARQIAEKRETRKRQEDMKQNNRVTLEDLFQHIQEGQVKELLLIVKADVQGSVEAVKQSLERLSTTEVKLNIIHGGVGAITETDIMLASASNAIVIGFNIRPDANARRMAEIEKVDVRLYRVIYDAIEDVKAAMSGLLEPEIREVALGRVEVRQIFKASKVGNIAGCRVVEGKITRDAGVRLIRDNIVIFEGNLDSLKRFKDDAKEVLEGFECGITLEKYGDIREGDIIEAYTTEAVKREL